MSNLILQSESGQSLKLPIGEERVISAGELHLKADNGQYREATMEWEADNAFVILDVYISEQSRYGSTGYSSQLNAKDAHVEEIQKITKILEGHIKSASESRDEDRKRTIEWLLKQLSDSYYKYTSSNARLRVKGWGQARIVKISLPWPLNIKVDHKNASLNLKVSVKVVRLISPQEVTALDEFLKTAFDKKEGFKVGYEGQEYEEKEHEEKELQGVKS